MPEFDELYRFLTDRGFQLVDLNYTITMEGGRSRVNVTVTTFDQRGEFEFETNASIERIAASIFLAFDKNRHLVLHEIPGAISLTHIGPPRGSAYDYGPEGVTLDQSSVSAPARRAWPPKAKLVPTTPKKSEEPKSMWDRLLGEDLV